MADALPGARDVLCASSTSSPADDADPAGQGDGESAPLTGTEVVAASPPKPRSIRFLDLTDDRCAFVEGEPDARTIETLMCCGAPVAIGSSRLGRRYCAEHRARLVIKPSQSVLP